MKWIPDRKVWAGGVFAVAAYIFVALVNRHLGWGLAGDETFLLSIALGKAAEWFIPPAKLDIIKRLDDDLVEMAAASPASAVSPQLQNVAAVIRETASAGNETYDEIMRRMRGS